MAMMAGHTYDAFKSVGVSDDKARAAAEEIAAVNRDQVDLSREFLRVRGEIGILKWMMGTMIVLQLGTLSAIVAFAINHLTYH